MIIFLQIINLVINIYTAFTKDKKKVLIACFVFNFINLLLMLIIHDYATVYSYIIISIRSFVYVFQDKLKSLGVVSSIIPFGFVVLQVGGAVVLISNLYQILPVIAPIIVCLYLWFVTDRQHMRLWQSLSDSLWLIYNAYVGLYINVLMRFASIASQLLAYYKNWRFK